MDYSMLSNLEAQMARSNGRCRDLPDDLAVEMNTVPREELLELGILSWKEAWKRDGHAVIKIARKLAHAHKDPGLDEDDAQRFMHARKIGQVARSAREVFHVDGEVDADHNTLISTLGTVKDRALEGHFQQCRKAAGQVLSLAKEHKPPTSCKAAPIEDIFARCTAIRTSIEERLREATLPAEGYHDLKRDVRRLVHLYRLLAASDPSNDPLNSATDSLVSVYKDMGERWDDWVQERDVPHISRKQETITVNRQHAGFIKQFLQKGYLVFRS